ncbi:MAG: hypothetical protein FRX49_07267 [Trebouxia sp. A1-2]|nr:MAG: hypothetical protein FRX49_07267 [Trebouxia sp. A1-2]
MTAAVQLSPRLSVCADTPPPAMTDCLQKMTPEKTLRRDLCKPDHGRAGATGGQSSAAKSSSSFANGGVALQQATDRETDRQADRQADTGRRMQ